MEWLRDADFPFEHCCRLCVQAWWIEEHILNISSEREHLHPPLVFCFLGASRPFLLPGPCIPIVGDQSLLSHPLFEVTFWNSLHVFKCHTPHLCFPPISRRHRHPPRPPAPPFRVQPTPLVCTARSVRAYCSASASSRCSSSLYARYTRDAQSNEASGTAKNKKK